MGKFWRSAQGGDEACRDEGSAIDARLVDGLRRRAPEALAGLHEQYAAGIYSLALRVVRHASDAEDITHDVLIRAYERLPQDREVRLRPWLYRLTLNRCYDHLRWSARRPLVAQGREAPSPHDPYEQSELQALLEASLGDLTRRQRAALLLKDVHGLSLVEVAACLDAHARLGGGAAGPRTQGVPGQLRDAQRKRRPSAPRLGRGARGAAAAAAAAGTLGAAARAVCGAGADSSPLAPLGPLAAATGGGIGALLGVPSSIKTAVLVAAAAASLGSAELVATRADQRPPRPQVKAATVSSVGSVHVATAELSAAHAASRVAAPSAPPRASGVPSSPAASASAEPSPQGSPLGIVTPSPSPLSSTTPDASPSATSSPDPHATTPSPTPTAPPSPTPTPSATPSPSPSPSPGAGGSPLPAPGL